MSDGQGVIRAISWRDLCPWLLILRTFGLSIRAGLLLAATLAVLITPLGWNLARVSFLSQETLDGDPAFRQQVDAMSTWPGGALPAPQTPHELGMLPRSTFDATLAVFDSLTGPFRAIFASGGGPRQLNVQQTAYYVFGSLWTLAIWAFFGGVITRVAAVELGREERLSIKEAVVFAARKYVAYFLAPISPLSVVLLVMLLAIPIGWLMRADATLPVAGFLWPLVLLGGFISSVVLLGLLFGWPLMWSTISAEGTDSFDAISRGYAYTFQRPLRYLFYAVVAVLFGALCWTLVSYFAEAVIQLGYWGVGWGADDSRVRAVDLASHGVGDAQGPFWFGASLIALCNGLVRCVAVGFGFSFFWCAATAIYLLLRQDVDQTEFDEIYMDDEEIRYGLPPLVKDTAGVPAVPPKPADTAPVEAPDGKPAAETPDKQPNES